MAEYKISQLPAVEGLAGSELVPVVQNSRTKQATINDLRGLIENIPSDSADPHGLPGQFSTDGEYLYLRLAEGWRRITLETF